jgi:hypothetical protein
MPKSTMENGLKFVKDYLEEIKKCVIVDIEEFFINQSRFGHKKRTKWSSNFSKLKKEVGKI